MHVHTVTTLRHSSRHPHCTRTLRGGSEVRRLLRETQRGGREGGTARGHLLQEGDHAVELVLRGLAHPGERVGQQRLRQPSPVMPSRPLNLTRCAQSHAAPAL